MSPLEHAQQRGHNDCIKILQTYGLRRPGSALSIASRVSLPTHAGDTPTLDEQGHVVLRRPNRRISLSGVSVSSMDRLPADGQAGSEDRREEGIAELASLTHPEEDGVYCTRGHNDKSKLLAAAFTVLASDRILCFI